MTSVAGQIKAKGAGGPCAPDIAFASDTWTISGGESSSNYTTRFGWHGFRYVEVTLTTPSLTATTTTSLSSTFTSSFPLFVGVKVNADVPSRLNLTTSDPKVNAVHAMVRNSILANLHSVQSDCPHRERFGYGGDTAGTHQVAMDNFDMRRFYSKTVQDNLDAQRANDGFTETAPFVGIADGSPGGGAGPVAWESASALVAWHLFTTYGDRAPMTTAYPHLRKNLRFLLSLRNATTGLIDCNCELGDWMGLEPSSPQLAANVFLYLTADAVQHIAGELGDKEGQKSIAASIADLRAAFLKGYYNATSGAVWQGTQFAQAAALALPGLLDAAQSKAAMSVLVRNIEAAGNHSACGNFGITFLFRALPAHGRADLAYAIATQTTYPSYLFMRASGATTLWESWQYSNNTFSHLHHMFGGVDEFLVAHVAGLRVVQQQGSRDMNSHDSDVSTPRPRQSAVVDPSLAGLFDSLTSATAELDTPLGRAAVAWRTVPDVVVQQEQEDEQQKLGAVAGGGRRRAMVVEMEVDVPMETEAAVRVPCLDGKAGGAAGAAPRCATTVASASGGLLSGVPQTFTCLPGGRCFSTVTLRHPGKYMLSSRAAAAAAAAAAEGAASR
eukprot:g3717.t1